MIKIALNENFELELELSNMAGSSWNTGASSTLGELIADVPRNCSVRCEVVK